MPVLGGRFKMTDSAKNTTELLDKLLTGYDNRLRPNFGGKDYFVM